MGIIGGSGLVLWFPELFAHVLPGWVFNIAMVVHGEEALLAVGFIFTIHFFNGHLRPEKFPMDSVIFTGRVTVKEMEEERPDELERLTRSGRIDEFAIDRGAALGLSPRADRRSRGRGVRAADGRLDPVRGPELAFGKRSTPMSPAQSRFSLFRNAITIFGAALTTTGARAVPGVLPARTRRDAHQSVHGDAVLPGLPGFSWPGLVLMPIGVWLAHRRDAAGMKAWRPSWPSIDLNDGVQRRAAAIFVASTVANILIVSVAAYPGIEYMDSPQFCGQLCHEVMEPEWAGYQEGPHSRVACIQCHIGPGAPWFVKSKISGLRQVYAVTFNTHSRPIPSPVHDLRPARDTCEQCHWPEKFHGDKIRTIRDLRRRRGQHRVGDHAAACTSAA